ncbi:MAG TPA: FAD-dependent oxidoreductase [Patescibacteria group bacterium]|nr:FAD-dependent oxidoreductase [Patescibacteria group bacterium]
MTLTFVGSEPQAGDVRSFKFKPDHPTTWVPGQYLHLVLPHEGEDDRGHKRWFTISAAPSDGTLAISTRIVAEHPSTFKQALAALKPGDTLECDELDGDFVLGDPARNYIFVAGGIGVTPYHSILREAGVQHNMPHATLVYGTRDNNIPFKAEFDELQRANPNLKIEYVVAPEAIDKDRLQKAIASVDKPIVYVSGPEPMVEVFVKDLEELGMPKDDIKTDYFPGYTVI